MHLTKRGHTMRMLPLLALALQNIAIFFSDIFHSIMMLQGLSAVILVLYFVVSRTTLKLYRSLDVWMIYILIVCLNFLVGGDASFILAVLTSTVTMVLNLSIPGIGQIEYKFLKCCSFIHFIFSVVSYVIPHTYYDGLYETLLGSSASSNYYWRVIDGSNVGITSQPGLNAFYLSIFIMICLIEIFDRKKKIALHLVLAGIAYVMIFTTGKRSSLLIVPLVAIYYICVIHSDILTNISLNKIVVGIALLVVGGIFIYWLITKSSALQIVLGKISKLDAKGDVSNGRFEIWAFAWKIFMEHPIFGNGLKSIYKLQGIDVHNTYIQILSETGIVGTLFFGGGLLNILSCCKKKLIKLLKKDISNYYCNSALGYLIILYLLIYGLVGNTFIDYVPLMVFYMAVVMCLNSERGNI